MKRRKYTKSEPRHNYFLEIVIEDQDSFTEQAFMAKNGLISTNSPQQIFKLQVLHYHYFNYAVAPFFSLVHLC